jgi:hypothetical protein
MTNFFVVNSCICLNPALLLPLIFAHTDDLALSGGRARRHAGNGLRFIRSAAILRRFLICRCQFRCGPPNDRPQDRDMEDTPSPVKG